jgi:aryl-alcohol dehydrogenase-like predicted oxidoreductase
MQQRHLGNTDLSLSVIGLGTWAIGGGGWDYAWGPQDDQRSIATIHRALDLGINWIDTAPVYGLGHSEQVIGQALSGMTSPPVIATKCTRVWGDEGKIYGSLKADSIKQEAEDSLRRLGVERIDLYQIHWADPEEDIEEAWGAIDELIREGKVRYGGVSNFDVAQIRRAQALHPVASLQPPYSMLRRGIEAEILPFCADQEIGVLAYSPMQKGLLTGKVTREWVETLPDDDHRRRDRRFQEPQLSRNLKIVDSLRTIAQGAGRSIAELAIAWTLRRPEITASIVGARSPEQIETTAPAGSWSLDDATLAAIEAVLKTE